MKQTINTYDFHNAFTNSEERKNQFTYEARDLIFYYLERLEEDTGEEIELDIIAICCDFSEEHYKDIACSYNIDLSEAEGVAIDEFEIVVEHLLDVGRFIGSTLAYQIVFQPY